jgi:DNA topoisomerase I
VVAVRLRTADPNGPGIKRIRHGRGFRYVDADGRPVDDGTRRRIKELVIPPAWDDVWICPAPNGHLQAVGTDDAGRRQYLCHPAYRRRQDEDKHRRVLTLARRLPEVRAAVAGNLRTRGLTRRRVVAAALRLLDHGVFRTGGEEYAADSAARAWRRCGARTYGSATGCSSSASPRRAGRNERCPCTTRCSRQLWWR